MGEIPLPCISDYVCTAGYLDILLYHRIVQYGYWHYTSSILIQHTNSVEYGECSVYTIVYIFNLDQIKAIYFKRRFVKEVT